MKIAINRLYTPFMVAVLVVFQTCSSRLEQEKAVKLRRTVEVRKVKDRYQLYRHGKPYYIRGAGGYQHFDKLRKAGGNSIRVWNSNDAQRILDEAHRQGLTVTLGLNISSPRYGFDYFDEDAVAKQLAEVRKTVVKFKDHPALLMWGIGNELNIRVADLYGGYFRRKLVNIQIWRAVNEIAAMIHELDPNHPTTTMLAGPSNAIKYINYLCPHIDIVSINTFGALPTLTSEIEKRGWEGPYIVSEWGPTGYWEATRTDWDVAIEETSTQKAAVFRSRYEASIPKSRACLGAYVFYWGVKQERTPTWFSLFLESGEATSAVDDLHFLWTGKYPENRSPYIDALCINGKKATDNVVLTASALSTAGIKATDLDGDTLRYRWEILPELTGLALGEGGDREEKPVAVPDLILHADSNLIKFKAPAKPGAYRLYSYVLDGHKNAATANIPFYVMP